MKTQHKGFKIGDKVKLIKSNVSDGIRFQVGKEFEIKNFPCSVWTGCDAYFVHGIDESGKHIRCFTNEIQKL